VGALRGIPRLAATYSVVQNVRLFGTAGTLVNAGTQFFVQGAPTSIFSSNAAVTLVAGQSCIQTLTFSSTPISGQFRVALWGETTSLLPYNVTAAALQTAIQSLPFSSGCTVTGSVGAGFTINFVGAGTGGFMVQPQFTIANNTTLVTITPATTQAGIDQGNVIVTATTTGPILANASTLNQIFTPVSGLTNVLNTQDAALGTNVETDNAYRTRMNTELQVAGAGTVEAIRSRLLKVSGVTSALVYENVTMITDGNGRPPKSFEAVVEGGSSADIGNTIWAAKPAGIQTYGTQFYVITDSQGISHTMYFSRPTGIDIYLIVNLVISGSYPLNGDLLVKNSLANYINGLGQGVEVIVSPQLIAQLASIPGIEDAEILAGTSPGPTLPNNIPIAAYQVAQTQTIYITVNH
jgi:uncharacterized phage protein gp47/JayE